MLKNTRVFALREDLQVSQPTVARWVDVLERVYGLFRLAPFGAPRLRAVKKERKHYHCDWGIVTDLGAIPRRRGLAGVGPWAAGLPQRRRHSRGAGPQVAEGSGLR